MIGDETDTEKAELAMEWAGLWKPGQQCQGCGDKRYDFYIWRTHHIHDIPCPDPLTDDAVAMRLLVASKMAVWRHPASEQWSAACSTTIYCDADVRLAIVRAAAAAAEVARK